MLSKASLKEIKRVGIGILILTLLMLAVYLIIGKFNTSVLYGALLGSGFSIINFVLLAYTVERSLEKEAKKASVYMGTTHILRLVILALMIYFAIKNDNVDYVPAIIPLFFQRIVIYVINYIKNKKDGDNNK